MMGCSPCTRRSFLLGRKTTCGCSHLGLSSQSHRIAPSSLGIVLLPAQDNSYFQLHQCDADTLTLISKIESLSMGHWAASGKQLHLPFSCSAESWPTESRWSQESLTQDNAGSEAPQAASQDSAGCRSWHGFHTPLKTLRQAQRR